MSNAQLETALEAAWDARDTITPATTGETREAIEDTLNALDSGTLRVAEKQADGSWHVNQWAKKAVLLGFRSGGRATRLNLVGQSGQQIQRLGRKPMGLCWVSSRSKLHRPQIRIYCTGRGSDAVLCELGRLRG